MCVDFLRDVFSVVTMWQLFIQLVLQTTPISLHIILSRIVFRHTSLLHIVTSNA
jgi:hypothetical protein